MTIGVASFGGEDGGVEEIQGWGRVPEITGTNLGYRLSSNRHLGCRWLVNFGFRWVWDCVFIVRIIDLPLERVSENLT